METLLLIFCLSTASSLSYARDQKELVHIAVLTENGSRDSGTDAYELAVALINNSTLILPDYQLQLIRGNGGCNDPPGLSPFLAAGVLSGTGQTPGIIGVIGPLCSSSAVFLGSLVAREELALIDLHFGVSAWLESRSNYPNSFGMVGSSSLFFHTVMELIRLNNWRVVNILYDNSQLYHASALNELNQDNITINEYFISPLHSDIPLSDFKFSSRITLLFMKEELVQQILCKAYHLGLVFPAYQFVVSVDPPFSLITKRSVAFNTHVTSGEYSCSADELAVAMEGAVFVSIEAFNDSLIDHMHTTFPFSFEEYESTCESVCKPLCSGSTDPMFPYLLDAFWSLALALNNSQLTPEELSFSPAGLSEQNEAIKQELLKLDFNGFSGPIRFSESTGFVARNVSLHQYVRGEMVFLGTVMDNVLEFEEQGEFLPWSIRVSDTVLKPEVPRVFTYFSFTITSAVFLVLCVLHILTVLYRNTAEVKATSYKLLHFAYAGCYLLVFSIFTHTYLEGLRSKIAIRTSCYLWHVLNTFVALGFTLVFSTLCLRTWRLYRIFVTYTNPGRFLSNRPLMAAVVMCVVVDGVIALVWVAVDPLTTVTVGVEQELSILRSPNGTVVDVVIFQETTVHCLVRSQLFYFWFLSLHSFYFLLAIVLVILVILTRHIPQERFKTQEVLRLDYVVMVSGILVISLYQTLLLLSTPEAMLFRFILFSLGINMEVILVCLLLYFPPIFQVTAKWLSSHHKTKGQA